MQVREIMTQNPMCCSPDTKLVDVARMMCECDCGEIPVVERNVPIGVVTDRDIVCRALAMGRNPLDLTAGDCMSKPVIAVAPETSLEDCCTTLEEHQIRRVPIVDAHGAILGIVSQADIARKGPARMTSEVVREVSRPTGSVPPA